MTNAHSDTEPNRLGRLVTIVIIIVAIGVISWIFVFKNHISYVAITQKSSIKLTSSAFKAGGAIPKDYTCQGSNINPPLTISNTPNSAKSLALIVHDPDAPSGDFTHWLLWNIPISTKKIAVDSVPAGAMQGTNDYTKIGYGAPCPSNKQDRYYFELYALDTKLGLDENAAKSDLTKAMQGHIVGQTTLMGTYGGQ